MIPIVALELKIIYKKSLVTTDTENQYELF